MLGVGRNTAFRLVHEKRIRALRLGKKLRVPLVAIQQLLSGDCEGTEAVR
jgi:excisionase family DNA binding protein